LPNPAKLLEIKGFLFHIWNLIVAISAPNLPMA
jgi:hypothetical protein